jgi:AcrR family transcriptional regulator
MRVTRQVRLETRRRLLAEAQGLFAEVGFAAATTREVARRAGVAAGTLFNYFPSKEALGAALLVRALEGAEAEFETTRRTGESLEETLFAWIAIQLRHLEPCRAWVLEVLDAGASLLRASTGEDGGEAERFRLGHLERVDAWLAAAGLQREGPLDLHLYWTLYRGVLAFWTRDDSHNQEATLALLDRSMGLFVRGLTEVEATDGSGTSVTTSETR